jgi:hypothetical protein
MIKKIELLLILLVVPILSYAVKSPLNDSYFIGEHPDSAAIGRGMAYTGVSGSPFAPYWNPAGLMALDKNMMAVSFNAFAESEIDSSIIKNTFPLQGKSLNYIAVCGPEVGVFWRPLYNGSAISAGTISGKTYSEKVEAKVNVFGVSVAVPHSKKMDFGMNINFLTGMIGYSYVYNGDATVEISDGYGWGLDWGLIYKLSPGVNLGVTLLNGPAHIYWEDYSKDKLPPILRAGIDMKLGNSMSVAVDYEKGFYDDSMDDDRIIHLGFERKLSKSLVLRGGVFGKDMEDTHANTYTTGIGYKIKGYSLDFAARQYYLNDSKSSGVKRFSVSGIIPF